MDIWGLLTANIPYFILMIVGTCLVAVEILLPGFGVPGITGLIAYVAGLLLMHPTPVQALCLTLIAGAILGVFALVFLKLCGGRFSRSKLVNTSVALSKDGIDPDDLSRYEGKTGTAVTALRPAGTAEIDGNRLDVVSRGEFIPAGTQIVVMKCDGNRIVVQKK